MPLVLQCSLRRTRCNNKGDAFSKLGEQKSKLTKQLKCLNEDFNKYTADSSKQSDFEVMKKLLER